MRIAIDINDVEACHKDETGDVFVHLTNPSGESVFKAWQERQSLLRSARTESQKDIREEEIKRGNHGGKSTV
jgi:hypothetical protein